VDISRWIERHAAFTPDKPAIRFAGRELSYAGLELRVRDLARGLKHTLGVGRGDRVAWLGYNHPDLLALLFACARLGAMLVPLSWRLAVPEHLLVLRDAGAGVLVVGEELAATGAILGGELAGCRCVALAPATERPGWMTLDAMTDVGGDDANPHVGPEAPLLLVYTSGTTGRPKGAVLTQQAIFCNALNSLHMHDLTSADRVLTVLPLFHVGGLNIQTTPALYAGAEVVLLGRFEPGATLEAIRELRPTLTVQVPATIRALLEHPDWAATDLGCLRMIATGSSIVPLPLLQAWHERGVPAAQVYGLTETCPIAVYQRAADALRKPGSTGRVALHGELRIVDAAGRDCPLGSDGELLVRGDNVMLEYWGDAAATAAAFVEGWFRTGDVGHLDAKGELWIVDRRKDVIISGGENIYPAELEAVLLACPAVREAAVVARPDPRWGEVPVAVIVRAAPTLDAAAVQALFEGRLARFKHPRAVVFVDALPRNAMGKVLRFRLREMVAGAA
jgi:fatty-acyl-CoA synthase